VVQAPLPPCRLPALTCTPPPPSYPTPHSHTQGIEVMAKHEGVGRDGYNSL
jgi:hypothetical protein